MQELDTRNPASAKLGEAGPTNPQLLAFIDKIEHLPPSPRLLIKLLEMFKQPDQDIHEVVQLISYDPSYTAEVLKTCNSAYFSGTEPAQDIFEAVSRLGFEELHKTVTAMFASSAILRPGRSAYVEILWAHSVTVAVGASFLAQQTGESSPTAFTAGLLHEVGKVIMIAQNEHAYVQVVQSAGNFRRPIYMTEKEVFGFDHAELAASLLHRWNLPQNIVAAVRHHHQLAGAAPYERLSAIVYLANVLAHATGEAFGQEPTGLAAAAGPAIDQLGLTPEQIVAMLPALRAALAKVRSITRG